MQNKLIKEKKSSKKLLLRILKKINRRTVTFLIFVLISAVLWLLNALSKTYSTEISIPVQYVGTPNNYMSHSTMPQEFTLQVEGKGFTILRYKIIKTIIPFKFDLSSYFSMKKDSVIATKIATQTFKRQIEQYLYENITVEDINPKLIDATFSMITFKKVAVLFTGDIKFAPQYWLKGNIEITPDSIIIGGPKNILDTVNAVYTKTIQKNDIRQKTVKNTIVDNRGIFKILNPEVKITVNAEKFTETSLRLPIRTINEPLKTNVMLFPDNATVKFLISLQEFERIDTSNFQLVADLSQINYSPEQEQIKIDLISYPETVKILNINPREVSFVISVKK